MLIQKRFNQPHIVSGRIHFIANIEARMRRLIIRHVLPGNRHPVHPIMHQGVIPEIRRISCGIKPQLPAVRRPENHLFPPIAKQIRLDNRPVILPQPWRCLDIYFHRSIKPS